MMRVSLFLFLLYVSLESFGWWDSGHQLVCDVAELHLSDSAKKELQDLLGGERKFAEGCVWPDTIKSKRPKTSPWHYINLPPDEIEVKASHCPDEGCIMKAFYEQLAVLKNKTADEELRKEALMFIGHFVGDIHQPFHVGNAEDRGANGYRVTMPSGRNRGMHAVWDGYIYNHALDTLRDDFNTVFFESFYSQAENLAYDQNIYAWATESRTIAMSDSVGYKDQSIKKIDRKYLDTHKSIVIDRLALASARLTLLLNGVFQ
jgi:hypothetical protein